jgi:ribose-phosphate pyrophosphokinase
MNPIIGHDYSGNPNLEGYTAIVIDDMISSGGSIFECIDELKKLGVNQIYVCVSFDLFTEGIEKFKEYYESGKFNGIYTTNLSYIPEEYRNMPWLHICDCSELVSKVIYNIHNNLSISDILKDRSYPAKLIEEKFEKAYAELDLSTEKEPKLTRNKPQN